MIAPQQSIRVKLGKSIDPSRRRQTLQTGSDKHLFLLAQSDRILEADLHTRFQKYRMAEGGTEFFELPIQDFVSLLLEFEGLKVSEPSSSSFQIDWNRISGNRREPGIKVYTCIELQEIARSLKINPSGMKKEKLAEEILKHRPRGEPTPIKVETGKNLLSRMFRNLFD